MFAFRGIVATADQGKFNQQIRPVLARNRAVEGLCLRHQLRNVFSRGQRFAVADMATLQRRSGGSHADGGLIPTTMKQPSDQPSTEDVASSG